LKALAAALVLLGLAALALMVVGQMGLLAGTPPTDLGVRDGRLKPPSATANSVSSQAALWPEHPQRVQARIAPLAAGPDGAAAMARLKGLIATTRGATVVAEQPGYLYVTYTTRWLRFTDDAEFWFDARAGVVQLRSASRLGESDLGVNRARIEELRARLAGAP
jgi:uncharacterized protein (DUF1499 family)